MNTKEIQEALAEELEEGFQACSIPEYMQDGMRQYVLNHIQPGGFLTSVLENNLIGAVKNADHINEHRIVDYVDLVYNYVSSAAWGSPEKVQKWLGENDD